MALTPPMPLLLRARLPNGEIDPDTITRAAALIRAGKLVAIPTETVYGLGANALDPAAVQGIFAAKGRPSFNPLIVHVDSLAQARSLAATWPARGDLLANAFWPGPLTLVVPRGANVPKEVTAGLDAVAVRLPSHPVARALIAAAGVPIAAPSANRSNGVSPTTAQHVLQSLGDRIDAILDDGPCDVGIESTVIDLTTDPPRLLRPGGLDARHLERLVGPIDRVQASVDAGSRLSPGMLSKHYAPEGHTRLVPTDHLAPSIAALPSDARIGVVALDQGAPEDPRIVCWQVLGRDPDVYARGIYAALHRMDETRATHVLIEDVPAQPAWDAVRDRISRAAG